MQEAGEKKLQVTPVALGMSLEYFTLTSRTFIPQVMRILYCNHTSVAALQVRRMKGITSVDERDKEVVSACATEKGFVKWSSTNTGPITKCQSFVTFSV